MFRFRKSREPRQIDPGAIVAANTIGKALVPSQNSIGGQVVDKDKIPRYNSFTGRSYSLVNKSQGGAAAAAKKPISRQSSVRHSSSGSSRYGSMQSSSEKSGSKVKSGGRSSMTKKMSKTPSNGSSASSRAEAERVFHDFGGKEAKAKYVPGPNGLKPADVTKGTPKMISKYIPSSHGLIKVEVPEDEYEAERKNSIRRSASMRSGMTGPRHSLSSKRSQSSLRSNSFGNKTPSGTPLRRLTEVSALEEKKDSRTSSLVVKPLTFTKRSQSPQTPEKPATKDLLGAALSDEPIRETSVTDDQFVEAELDEEAEPEVLNDEPEAVAPVSDTELAEVEEVEEEEEEPANIDDVLEEAEELEEEQKLEESKPEPPKVEEANEEPKEEANEEPKLEEPKLEEPKLEDVKVEEPKEEPKEDFKEDLKEDLKEEPKEDLKEEPKEQPKEEPKEEPEEEAAVEDVKLEEATEVQNESKEESEEEPKQEVKEESKEEPKQEVKEESKEEPKQEVKEKSEEEPKQEVKEEAKDEPKPEVIDSEELPEPTENLKIEDTVTEHPSTVINGGVENNKTEEVTVVNETTTTELPNGKQPETAKDTVETIESPKSDDDIEGTNKSSLAQYIRSANPELQRVADDNSINLPKNPLEKSPSPIKSAMKKTKKSALKNPQAAHASGAYLSLTTKENTRLNAQLSHENLRETASAGSGKRLNSPSLKRNQRPQSMMAQRVNGDRRSFIQTNSPVSPRNDTRPRSNIGKPTVNAKALQNSALYPKEPPQKRSSFEKQRPTPTSFAFRNLSLRQEPEQFETQPLQEPLQPPSAQFNGRSSRNSTPQKAPVRSSIHVSTPTSTNTTTGGEYAKPRPASSIPGFKSRFADSDSDDESATQMFSQQGSRSTQLSSQYETAPTPPVPYNPNATLRPIKEPESQSHSNHNHHFPSSHKHKQNGVPTEKKKGTFSKLKKLFGKKKH